jgi:hypothetical protein
MMGTRLSWFLKMRSKNVKYLLAEKLAISILPRNLPKMSAIKSLKLLLGSLALYSASFSTNYVLPTIYLFCGSLISNVSKNSKLIILFTISWPSEFLNRSVVNSKVPKSYTLLLLYYPNWPLINKGVIWPSLTSPSCSWRSLVPLLKEEF